jgi:hypothetical protein
MRAAQQAARDAERRFPVRVRIAVPPEGLGSRLDQIMAWLGANCGADGWTSTPSSTRGVVNDALAVYFLDVTIASAFVARWCAAQRVEIVDGVYQVRDDEPTPRVGAALHKTPSTSMQRKTLFSDPPRWVARRGPEKIETYR